MKIYDNQNKLLSIVIKFDNISSGKNFITSDSEDFQLASFGLSEGEVIEKHYHPKQDRNIRHTSEVLVLIEGEMTVKIFDNNQDFVQEIKLTNGDTIGFFDGGHGIKLNKNCKFIEVKQGPFDEETDKIRF
tara:strand:+ start:119 stop:511 length:393 start_codon:yes stop_codon:yes gene_type:complete